MLMLTTSEWVQIAVAVASGAVAVATGVLAWKTRALAGETKRVAVATELEARAVAEQARQVTNQAEASQQQAKISAAALEASIQPWLTRTVRVADQVRVGVDREGARLNVYVWLRNVGSGIALIKPDACTITGKARGTNDPLQRIGHVDQPALPPGDVAVIGFRIEGPGVAFDSFTRRDSSQWGEFWVSVPYTDATGGQEVRADIHIAGDREGVEWRMVTIDYVRPPAEQPFARVRFDTALRSAD